MNLLSKITVTTAFLTLPLFNFAQEDDNLKKANPKQAEEKLLAGNYDEALDDFLSLVADEPQNDKYNYNIGVCYLNVHGNKAKAIPYLEKVSHHPKHDPNTDYLLGRAYHYANRFDDAIKTLTKFKEDKKGTADNLKDVDQQIQYCLNAKELMKYPLDVTFENMGSNINSEYNEHYAFVPIDEAYIIFNTSRPEKTAEKMENGEYKNSIYISEVKNGEFQKSYNIGAPVSIGNSGAEVIGLSASGDIMLLYIYDGKKSGNIYMSEKDEHGAFKKPVLLDKNINSPAEDISASISSDGNILYFTSNRNGGLGGTDIYMCKKEPNGKWSIPQNLGPTVNTPQNEDFPNISPDGQILYFSSNGHTSMGGYDIFKARWNDETDTWENAQNLGYPINTTGDDLNFRISRSQRYGYISTVRDKGYGDFDNYRVIFNSIEPELSVLRGKVLSEDSTQLNYPDVFITVTNEKTNEIMGNYLPNPSTGNYVIILPPGKYVLDVELFGFKISSKKIEILDKVSFQSEIETDLKLQVQK